MAWEVWQTSPWPKLLTRTVCVGGIQLAVTHGPLATGGGGKAQPAISSGGALIGTGVPIILTRTLGAEKLALPPWAHSTTALIVNSIPGIRYITSRPPLLMVVLAGVISTIPIPVVFRVTPALPVASILVASILATALVFKSM